MYTPSPILCCKQNLTTTFAKDQIGYSRTILQFLSSKECLFHQLHLMQPQEGMAVQLFGESNEFQQTTHFCICSRTKLPFAHFSN
jgi:hypothetical protein